MQKNKNTDVFPPKKASLWRNAISGALIGCILFFLLYGYAPLIPTNVSYLYNNPDHDVMSHQLGFDFYRHSPWTHPVGLTQNYPYPYMSSVVNSDSIPVFAFLFKFLSPILPEYFQYFGLWILLCFILQGISSALLLKSLNIDYWHTLVSVPFFICNVPILFRCFHHSALAGQWLILLCFLLIIKQKDLSIFRQTLFWSLLCGLSILIHGYLFFMVGFIMTMNCLWLIVNHFPKKAGIIFLSCIFTFFLFYYESGGFIVKSNVPAMGLGEFSLNLTDFFNPAFSGWFSPLYNSSSEGALYLGIGILILCAYVLVKSALRHDEISSICQKHKKQIRFILFSIFICTVISLGVCGHMANTTLYDLRPLLSPSASAILSTFRSSSRFMLPVWYLILLVIILLFNRLTNTSKYSVLILSLFFCLQYTDIVPATVKCPTREVIDKYDSLFCTSYENVFTSKAKHLCLLGPNFIQPVAVYAAHNNMSLNASKVGRGPKNSLQADTDNFNSGILYEDTVYIIELSNIHYLSPITIPPEYHIYLCDQLICIAHQDLFIHTPDHNSVEIPSAVFAELITQVREMNGPPEPISTYEDL